MLIVNSLVFFDLYSAGAVPSWLMPGGLASVPLDLPQPKDDDDDDDDEEDEDEDACLPFILSTSYVM